METTIEKNKLKNLSNEELTELTRNHAVEVHMYNGAFTQLCVNDFKGIEPAGKYYVTMTGIIIPVEVVKCIVIIDKENKL